MASSGLAIYTTGDIAKRLGMSRSSVIYAIDRARIEPVHRAGIVRLFSAGQWPEIVAACRAVGGELPCETPSR